MVKIMNRRLDAVGVLAAVFGAAVVIPSLIALSVAIVAVLIELF